MANGEHISLHVKDFNHSTRSDFEWLDLIQSGIQPSGQIEMDTGMCHIMFIDWDTNIKTLNYGTWTHLVGLHSHYRYILKIIVK